MKTSKQGTAWQGWSRRRAGGYPRSGWAAFLAMISLGILAMMTSTARAQGVSLRYTLDPGGPPVFTLGQELLASDKPIEAVKLPPLHSKKPLYLTAKLGDGADFTAADVKATYERIAHPPKGIVIPRTPLFATVGEIVVLDPHRIEFRLTEPRPRRLYVGRTGRLRDEPVQAGRPDHHLRDAQPHASG